MASNSDYKKGTGTVGEEASAIGERVKGAVKQGAGKLTGNELLEQEGRIEKTSGAIRQSTNDVIGPDTSSASLNREDMYNQSARTGTEFGSTFDRTSGSDYNRSTNVSGSSSYGSGTVGEEASAFGQRVKGAVKEGTGNLIGNERLAREGDIENKMGNMRQSANDVVGDRNTYGSSSYGSSNVSGSGTVGEEVSAFGQRVKGAVKEGAGKLVGNERLAREGDLENKMGNMRQERNDVIGDQNTYGSSSYGATGTTSSGRLVTGLYNTREDAERAWGDLTTKHGYKNEDISVLMSDDTRKRHFGNAKPGEEFTKDTKAMEGLGVGSALGGTLGAIIGAIAAIGTNLVLPGIGLVVAGPLAAAFAGAGVGGAAGGLIGALVGAGIPEDRAREYEHGIKSGGIVLGAHARDDKHAADLERDFTTYGGRQVIK